MLPHQHRTLSSPRPIDPLSINIHSRLQLTFRLFRNRKPTTQIPEPEFSAATRILHIEQRARLDTMAQVTVRYILDVGDVFTLRVGSVALDGVGQGGIIDGVGGGLEGVGGRGRVD